jgi:membrane protein YqaA with SNARE-associated domain
MVHRKIPILTFVLVVGVVVSISVVLLIVASGTSNETWESVGYPSAFLLGLIGAASVIIPVPTTVVLLSVAVRGIFDPTLLALAFGFGAAVGQLTSYMVGYAGRMAIGNKRKRHLDAMLKIFERYGMIAVFIFALTPLPDSLLFIPMGLVHYSLWKIFVAAVAGKITMSLIITHFGGIMGQTFTENWIFAGVTTVLLIIAIIVMFRIDWEKIVAKYLLKRRKSEALNPR